MMKAHAQINPPWIFPLAGLLPLQFLAQVDGLQYSLHWSSSCQSWSIEGPLPVVSKELWRFWTVSPVTLLPACQASSKHQQQHGQQHHRRQLQQQHEQQQHPHQRQLQHGQLHQRQQEQQQPELMLPVRVCLTPRDGASQARVVGWSACGGASADAPADAPFSQHIDALSVLACVRGRYLPTRVMACVEGGCGTGAAQQAPQAAGKGGLLPHAPPDAATPIDLLSSHVRGEQCTGGSADGWRGGGRPEEEGVDTGTSAWQHMVGVLFGPSVGSYGPLQCAGHVWVMGICLKCRYMLASRMACREPARVGTCCTDMCKGARC